MSKSQERRTAVQKASPAKASSNPSKAESRANLKTTFGTPKKQK